MISMEQMIRDECKEVEELLVRKNKAYGNSALNPVRIFSKANTVEQIRVRLDDKISRQARGQDTDAVPEDLTMDMLGYLVLLRIAERLAKSGETAPN